MLERRSPRFPIQLEVIQKRPVGQGVTRNVSREGMFICTTNLVAVGTRLLLQVNLPDSEIPLEVAAEVVRLELGNDEAGMGVRLLHAGEAQQAYFEGQLRRLARETTQPDVPVVAEA